MRAMRLPPAVVARITSFLPTAEASPPAVAGPSRRPPVPVLDTPALVSRIRRLSCAPAPPSPSALDLAHAHLNARPFHFPTASAGALGRRRRLYSELVRAFLAASPPNVGAATSLLGRQAGEHVTPDTHALTAVLQAALGSGQPAVAAVRAVLAILPEQIDKRLLTLVVTATIRDAAPPPTVVRQMVAECLGPDTAWGWDIWDVVLSAYVPHGDFRGALECLGEARRKAKAGAAGSSSSSGSGDVDSDGGPARAFTTVLALWTSTRFRLSASATARAPRLGSHVPQTLARALAAQLAVPPAALPAPFLIAWLNAERVADNLATASAVCAFLTGLTPAQLGTAIPPAAARRIGALPPEALAAVTKLLKLVRPASWRPLAALVPPRANSHIVDAVLAAAAGARHPDLALMLHLAQTHPAPTPRTIDVVAAGLVRASRAGLVPGLFEHDRLASRKGAVGIDEWDMVGRRLHEIRQARAAELALRARTAPAHPQSTPRPIPLPLSTPHATLDPDSTPPLAQTTPAAPLLETHRAVYPAPPPASGPGVTFAPSRHAPVPPSSSSAPAAGAADAIAPPALTWLLRAPAVDPKPRALVGPAVALLKAAVVLAYRVTCGARAARGPDAAALSAEMARVRQECGRRPIRWNKWGERNL
ncbi:hypothetical protein Q5752_004676 [Cryptotrichosporon argae]